MPLAGFVRLLDEISRDARHALRLWAKRPLQTGFAFAALLIGIGANTGVFSVVNALLLRSLPFQDPDRLAAFTAFIPPQASAQQFHDWAAQTAYLADAAVFEEFDFNIGSGREIERAHVAQASSNFFSLLGTKAVIGRTFAPNEDATGRDTVAVISYGLWQQLFAGEPRALGSIIRLAGAPLTIIGVAPPGFDFPSKTALWKAGGFSAGNNGWQTIARLKPGISWSQARAAFLTDAERLHPDRRPLDRIEHPWTMLSLRDTIAGPVKKASLLMLAGVAMILLIACTNVANLVQARTTDRAAELSIRSALGASRSRLMRQLLTECLLLSTIAGIAGLVIAFWTASLATAALPAELAAQSYKVLDGRVLAFAAAVSLLTGIIFGILPSLSIGRLHIFVARGSTGQRNSRFAREALLTVQVMLTIVLLTASLSIGRAFFHLMRTDRGFDFSRLVTVNVSLDGTVRGVKGRQLPYFEEALAKVRRLPGVQSASATEFLPLYSTAFIGGLFGLDGRPAKTNSDLVPVLCGYFQTMGGRILYGREFTDEEVRSDAKVAVVNEEFARQFGALRDALGHQVTMEDEPPLKIIGVAKGMDFMSEYISGIGDKDPQEIFVPAQSPGSFFSTFIVRVNDHAEQRVAMIRDAIRSVDPEVPVFGAKTMQQRLDDALSRPKFYRTAAMLFAGFALLLVVVGMYGAVSYAVAQRTREMGVRLALGTTEPRLRRMLLRQNLAIVTVGLVLGAAAATACARFLSSLIEGADSRDLPGLTLSALFIALIASTSVWTATRPIAKLDIAEILRAE